ncbi:MAG: tryptophan synthase subunit alpha [Candidatus Bathyarchaeia archaeon]
MRKIEDTFRSLKKHNHGALVAYVTAGDPKPKYTPRIVEALINGGADIIELGIPFSDPIADGPTIQAATVRALKAGATPKKVLKIVQGIKKNHDIPIAVLTYYNPIFKMGLKNFFKNAQKCEVDGLIVPDLTIEEANDYKMLCETYEIDTIFFAAPSTPIERLQKIINYTSGFLYFVSLFGVTGAREKVQDLTIRQIKNFLPYTKELIPLCVGFGISKPEHVTTVIQSGADGVIVGSVFVKIVEENQEDIKEMLEEIEKTAYQLKKATKNFKHG